MVPLDVQVGLVGQAAPHHVVAVVLAGFQSGQSAAVGTVHHPGQGHAAAWEYVHLRQRTVPPLSFHLLFHDIRHQPETDRRAEASVYFVFAKHRWVSTETAAERRQPT